MYYYYDRDFRGKEHCHRVEDDKLIEDMSNRLLEITDDDYPVDIIYEDDVYGYDSVEEFLEEEGEDNLDVVAAMTVGVEAYGYPFALVYALDESVSVCPLDKIPWRELVQEFAGPCEYQVTPDWYKKEDIDLDDANRLGMRALVKMLHEDNE